jgi:hypothetical protein
MKLGVSDEAAGRNLKERDLQPRRFAVVRGFLKVNPRFAKL